MVQTLQKPRICESNQFIFASGIAAGSIAAGVQGTFYGGTTAGVFTTLQAAGAAGLSATGKLTVGTTAAVFTKMIFCGS